MSDNILRESIDSEIKLQSLFKGEKFVINYYGQK